jgi:UDP-glucose 4-epimerase
MVIPNLVAQALRGDDMTVFGTGRQTRCFAQVSEVVVAMADLLECKPSWGQVVNIGSDEEVSILQLAKRIKAMTRSRSKIVLVPYEKAYEAGFEDMERRVPNLSRARKLVGYRPKATLDDILKSVIEHLKAQRPAP